MADSWSETVQGIETLESSRSLRFRDERRDEVLRVLGLEPGMTVLDAGCGPGALTRRVARWLGPRSNVVGVDRDAGFVRYAAARARDEDVPNARFLRGDALALPLADASFDACFSHTLIEHVPNRDFLVEQKRVCRAGGRVAVMSVRPGAGLRSESPGALEPSRRERDLWRPIEKAMRQRDERTGVGQHWPEPWQLPALFQAAGFTHVGVDALALPVAADDGRLSSEERRAIVEAERRQTMEAGEIGRRLVPRLSPKHVEELRRLVEARFEKRLSLLARGASVWDYYVSLVLVVSGRA